MYSLLHSESGFQSIHYIGRAAHPWAFINRLSPRHMNALNLPEPIAAYFAAEHNPDALGKCFTTRGLIASLEVSV
jgi:hypothetical protein